jgi:hypothetical protein
MFDNLSQRLEGVWDTVRKDGKLTADNIKTPMREIRRALLEADVSPALHCHHSPALHCTLPALHALITFHACQMLSIDKTVSPTTLNAPIL